MMFPRAVFAVLTLVALASAVPIDPKLQSVVAQKNNMGLINPPSQANSNGSGRAVLSGAGIAFTAAGVVAAFV